jgi:phenylalanyl-tRNA synthetase beta chain
MHFIWAFPLFNAFFFILLHVEFTAIHYLYIMNISYKWLREYVDFDLTAEEVAAALTSIGLEVGSVEEVQSIKGGLEGLWTGHVLTCEVHPNSDHMHVCSVDVGQESPLQIVCGAPNVALNQLVVAALEGAVMPSGLIIVPSSLRGVDSQGMLCSARELNLPNAPQVRGILVLDENEYKIGDSFF